jgi:hypothetical protein
MDSNLIPERNPGITQITSREKIEAKLLTFYEKMNRIAAFLRNHNAPADIQINSEEIYLECYIDKPAIARLMTIAMQDNFAQFGVFFGLEDPASHGPEVPESTSFGQLTACFLGLDANQNILGCHFPKGSAGRATGEEMGGEDTWPPPPIGGADKSILADLTYDMKKAFTLFSKERDIEDYFEQAPGPKPVTS